MDLQVYARKGLEAELARLDAERARVLSLLASLKGGTAMTVSDDEPASPKRSRQMSEAGRQAIREAVQRRWARVKAAAAASAAGVPEDKARGGLQGKPGQRTNRAARTGNRKK